MFPALIASLFSPAVDLIKKIISKDEDQTEALAKLEEVQNKMVTTLMEADRQKYDLMKTEAASSNWITSAWRPLSSLAMVVIVILSSFGLIHPNEQFWNLANSFLGIYAGSRGAEKLGDIVGNVINKGGRK